MTETQSSGSISPGLQRIAELARERPELTFTALAHQIDVMVRATAGKDRAHRELLPAPYVSALMDGCIETASDITAGGARYDFTSL